MNLFRRLKQVLWPPPQEAVELHHERLGVLTLEEVGWTASIRHADQELFFSIGGRRAPDPMCLQHAVDIVQNLDAFLARVRTFLREEARENKCFAEEIVQLRLKHVCLFRPKHPNDVELFFVGPDEFKVWHCNDFDRQLRCLGFDS